MTKQDKQNKSLISVLRVGTVGVVLFVGMVTSLAKADTYAGVDWSLSSGSPLIDMGVNADNVLTFDLNGNLRIVGAKIDLGAIEYPLATGMNEVKSQSIALFAPNPVKESIYFSETMARVEVYTLQSVCVLCAEQVDHLSLKHLSAGNYLLKMLPQGQEGAFTQTLIKR